MDRFCDYHQEKGHHTNDCHQLKRQFEGALESGKLNHLIKDERQRGRGNQGGIVPSRQRKVDEHPITFPPVSMEDVSNEPLLMEAEVEGYFVRRVYVDGGALVEVMFEHCFENLSPAIRVRLKETQTDMVGFTGEATKPLGKIELEVCFGSEGLCGRTMMKFTVIRALSPYNVILGRTGLRDLRAIPSTIHSMLKFLTPKGITTLVTRSVIISECRRLEKKKVVKEEKKEEVGTKMVNVTVEVLVNLAFLDQLVVIGGGLSETYKAQLKLLLKDNMDIFSWEPADMTGVPRRIIEHNINVNTSIEP
ncbi:reverse transcriptase domain-containing protein, partial [Tanacetum coccineum]